MLKRIRTLTRTRAGSLALSFVAALGLSLSGGPALAGSSSHGPPFTQ